MSKNKNIVYLDNNATTELSQDAASIVMDVVVHNIYGNPSSSHSFGEKSRIIVETARYGVAQSLSCSAEEIIFTSGGTEANNLALKGMYNRILDDGKKILISAAEHSSVYRTAEWLAGEENVVKIPLSSKGNLNLRSLKKLMTDDVACVSVMLANNITGAIFQVPEIVKLAHKKGIPVHCDAVQAFGKIPVNINELGVDLLSISGHKVHALPGVGALYVRKGLYFSPLIHGGNQEFSFRSGTENYIGIATLGASANEIYEGKFKSPEALREMFEKGIKKRIPNIVINAADVKRVGNTSSVTFKGIHSSAMLVALEEHGVCASSGSACSSGAAAAPNTLLAMGVDEEDALSTVRFSLSSVTKISDVAQAIEACVKSAKVLREGTEKTT